MNIITWKIDNLERSLPDGTVVTAHWRVNGTDGQHHGTAYGSVGLERDPEAANFIPYEELTEEVVLGWVKDKLGAEQVAAMEANVAAQIEAQAAPIKASGTPWA